MKNRDIAHCLDFECNGLVTSLIWDLDDETLDSNEPCGLACHVEPQSLAQLYSSKTDDDLLVLAADADSLSGDARPILESEIRRRNLLVAPPDVKPPAPRLRDTAVGKFFRSAWEYLLNYVVAVIGTAMMESSIWSRIGHAHSVSEVLTREWLLGPTIAALLGFFVGKRWLSKTAPWVWTLPAGFFAIRVLLYGESPKAVSSRTRPISHSCLLLKSRHCTHCRVLSVMAC